MRRVCFVRPRRGVCMTWMAGVFSDLLGNVMFIGIGSTRSVSGGVFQYMLCSLFLAC